MDTKKKKKKISPYMVFSTIVIILLAIAFAFPLYWILTGSLRRRSPSTPPPLNGGRASGS